MRFEIAHPADHRPVIRRGVKRGGIQLLVQHAVDIVVGAQPALFLHDLDLALELLGQQRQRRHAIRIEIERNPQPVGGDLLVVRGHVVVGERVRIAAVRLEDAVVDLGRHVLRSVEHHVLEEVRDPGDARALIARAHAIPLPERHRWHAVILVQQHGEPVVEHHAPHRKPIRARTPRRARGGHGVLACRAGAGGAPLALCRAALAQSAGASANGRHAGPARRDGGMASSIAVKVGADQARDGAPV